MIFYARVSGRKKELFSQAMIAEGYHAPLRGRV